MTDAEKDAGRQVVVCRVPAHPSRTFGTFCSVQMKLMSLGCGLLVTQALLNSPCRRAQVVQDLVLWHAGTRQAGSRQTWQPDRELRR